MNKKKSVLAGCYYTYFIAGAMSLVIGAVLPSLMEKCNLNYAEGGILLSAHSIGFLICSTLTGLIAEFLGRKRTVVLISILIPIALFGLAFTQNPIWLFVFLLFTGFGRGVINNTNNITVSTLADGAAGPVNILHSFFAVGGCLAPAIVALCLNLRLGFEAALILLGILGVLAVITYLLIDIDSVQPSKPKDKKGLDVSFLKNMDFYLIFGIMLFYLCSETSINGWLTTYLNDTGLMPKEIAPLMVSMMWLVMIGGRLIVAGMSKKVSVYPMLLILSAGAAVAYGIFTVTHNPVFLPILILCIGLFLAGIYPTSVSALNLTVDFSAFGMGLAMGGAGIGSIVMPTITGFVSQNVTMSAGMVCIWITVVLMLGCSMCVWLRNRKRGAKEKECQQ